MQSGGSLEYEVKDSDNGISGLGFEGGIGVFQVLKGKHLSNGGG